MEFAAQATGIRRRRIMIDVQQRVRLHGAERQQQYEPESADVHPRSIATPLRASEWVPDGVAAGLQATPGEPWE